jgi:hypothetical protein
MKLDLNSTSERFCGVGMLALLAQQLFPDGVPAWLGWYSAAMIIVGLCLMLAHEVGSRRRARGAATSVKAL